ncbi:YcxB family protein [Enterococcus caccae]|uniref:YcxB-like protein domain-containing protein n=1 Tax=Enterococcus caccae ATCC BAA-1240 TaxID=1158612 RepID=R3TQ21_9ENTE|nr:hypothetical protein [Enterococcus caccae]EOL43634.1 hypothetical protein UC7_02964 [Enterococcus caccae ATCC BAA-1240]EOT67966.1 hypothetical protein I580_00348 [Enterococcus caccae ATCC BAA-1240]
MDLKFTQTLTQHSWLAFNKIYMKKKYKRRRFLLVTLSIISFFLSLISIYLIWTFFQQDSFTFTSVNLADILHYCPLYFYSGLLFLIVGIELFLIYYKEIDFRLKKSLKDPSNSSFFVEKVFMISSEAVKVNTKLSVSTYEWSIFTTCIETSAFIALQLNSFSVLLIQKEELSQEQLSKLKQIITEKMADSYDFWN